MFRSWEKEVHGSAAAAPYVENHCEGLSAFDGAGRLAGSQSGFGAGFGPERSQVVRSDASRSVFLGWFRDGVRCRSRFCGGARMIKRTLGSVVVGAALLVSGSLQAHHSLAGVYDIRGEGKVSGVLTKVAFTNPHGAMTLQVKNAGWHDDRLADDDGLGQHSRESRLRHRWTEHGQGGRSRHDLLLPGDGTASRWGSSGRSCWPTNAKSRSRLAAAPTRNGRRGQHGCCRRRDRLGIQRSALRHSCFDDRCAR